MAASKYIKQVKTGCSAAGGRGEGDGGEGNGMGRIQWSRCPQPPFATEGPLENALGSPFYRLANKGPEQ